MQALLGLSTGAGKALGFVSTLRFGLRPWGEAMSSCLSRVWGRASLRRLGVLAVLFGSPWSPLGIVSAVPSTVLTLPCH